MFKKKNRKLLVSLPPEIDEALSRFSTASGIPQTKFIIDCLQQQIPSLNALSDAFEARAKGDNDRFNELLRVAAGEALISAATKSKELDSEDSDS